MLFVGVFPPSQINFWMVDSVFLKLAMYITAPEPISNAYVINSSCQSLYPTIVARQRPGKKTLLLQRIYMKQ
jgi:hypothetical protein